MYHDRTVKLWAHGQLQNQLYSIENPIHINNIFNRYLFILSVNIYYVN